MSHETSIRVPRSIGQTPSPHIVTAPEVDQRRIVTGLQSDVGRHDTELAALRETLRKLGERLARLESVLEIGRAHV